MDVHYPRMEKDEVTYHFPAEFTLENSPQPTSISWPDHAVLKAAANANQNTVVIGRTVAFNFTVLAPKEYGELHDFYQKVATADQQQLALIHSPVAKGN